MKKQGFFTTKIIMAILAVFVVTFMGYHVLDAFRDPVGTVDAVLFSTRDTFKATGYFVRDELVLDDAPGIVELQVLEGERLKGGQAVAVVYSDESTRLRHIEARTLQARVEQLELAKSHQADITSTTETDRRIDETLRALVDTAANRDFANLPQAGMEFRAYLYSRAYVYGGEVDLDGLIADGKSRLSELSGGDSHGLTSIRVTEPGTFSTVIDGYEGLLTPNMLDTLSVADLDKLPARRQAVTVPEGLGKQTRGFSWYFAATLSTADAAHLTAGGAVEVDFALRDGGPETIKVSVRRIGPEENGRRVVVLESTRDMARFLPYRRQQAEIVWRSYSGVRIPRDGVRMVEGVPGVYCLVAGEAKFKPIAILLERDNYYLIEYAPGPKSSVLPGDEIIVGAKDLFDGKVLT